MIGGEIIIRNQIYNLLVNKHPGIKNRYHKFHDGSVGIKKYLSWVYLLWLNFCYYFLFFRFLGEKGEISTYEEKKLPLNCSESEQFYYKEGLSVERMVKELSAYEVVSFDIFDTLIFRPFSEPTDLFFFIGDKLGAMDFKRIRMEMEHKARILNFKKHGSYEVTLREIWDLIETETGISAEEGMQVEIELEMKFCYANPFMLEVYNRMKQLGKKIIVISDMYLSEKYLRNLLSVNGYDDIEHLYVSCEYRKNKGTGELFQYAINDAKLSESRVHVGDNPVGDVTMAKKHGFASYYYPNVNKNALMYRAYDMSPMVGGAYRGVVNNHIYNGLSRYSMEYEYGYIYGGLFVTGYCSFIHDYCKKNGIDKVLFLSRDGDILKQAYEKMFPNDKVEYVFWSRRAAIKLMAVCDKYDFYRRFLYHKVNQDISIMKIFSSMDLNWLLGELPLELRRESLTDKNVENVKKFMEERWERILKYYDAEHRIAKEYFEQILSGVDKAVAVDIGWAGSGAIAIRKLTEKVWKLPCEVIGIIAGTNTVHNVEPDASESFLQSGKLVSYLYSSSDNRDLMKKHDLNKNYNVYWELLLSSPTPQFKGFGYDLRENKIVFQFGDYDENKEGILEIQKGILDFVSSYVAFFSEFPYMLKISGRDAYAPMLVAASCNEAYLKQVEKKFNLQINVS